MQLKRGIERVSCDFCHRRKIKCDRPSRVSRGHEACSQCTLREAACCVDDSDDIRARKRRQETVHEESFDTYLGWQHGGTPDDVSKGSGAAAQCASQNTTAQNADPSVPSQNVATPSPPQDNIAHLPFLNDPFELSMDGSYILDQTFTWDSPLLSQRQDQRTLASTMNEFDTEQFLCQPSDSAAQAENYHEQFWSTCDLDSIAFNNALRAYFQFAAVSLPIIFEDAFWKDYDAGACSRSLVFAVACRGIPYTSVPDKWDTQQRLAAQSRRALIEAGSKSKGDGLALDRIDDLEALALMAGFGYDDQDHSSSPLQANLERLLLGHDSLVIMTLRFCRQAPRSHALSSLETPARFDERRTLLLWHVYGVEAFQSLDAKAASRISDQEVDAVPSLLKHTSLGYLDAVLALAVIARKILQTLCTTSTKLRGIKSKDLVSLYAQLEAWQQNTCPLPLRKQRNGAGELVAVGAGGGPSGTSIQLQLHRGLVWFLELNCYMQIDSIVNEFGIHAESGFEAEMMALRVGYETMRAAQDIVGLAPWMGRYQAQDDAKHSLVDLSPILRDICAGTCVWICARGKSPENVLLTCKLRCRPRVPEQTTGEKRPDQRHYVKHQEMATLLRDTVATATSHRDTGGILERLDEQLDSLALELEGSLD